MISSKTEKRHSGSAFFSLLILLLILRSLILCLVWALVLMSGSRWRQQ